MMNADVPFRLAMLEHMIELHHSAAAGTIRNIILTIVANGSLDFKFERPPQKHFRYMFPGEIRIWGEANCSLEAAKRYLHICANVVRQVKCLAKGFNSLLTSEYNCQCPAFGAQRVKGGENNLFHVYLRVCCLYNVRMSLTIPQQFLIMDRGTNMETFRGQMFVITLMELKWSDVARYCPPCLQRMASILENLHQQRKIMENYGFRPRPRRLMDLLVHPGIYFPDLAFSLDPRLKMMEHLNEWLRFQGLSLDTILRDGYVDPTGMSLPKLDDDPSWVRRGNVYEDNKAAQRLNFWQNIRITVDSVSMAGLEQHFFV